jgi:Phosphatidylglycerophosphate synthase
MKIKFPNYLTIGRIIIVPFFVLAYYLPGFYGDIIPFTLFVIASFTDFFGWPTCTIIQRGV